MIDTILDQVSRTFKEEMLAHSDLFKPQQLTSSLVSRFTLFLFSALALVALKALHSFLLSFDSHQKSLTKDGKTYYYKFSSPKTFLTLFGNLTLSRSLYQSKDGDSFIPLDHHWNMSHQFATPEVHEITAFSMALLTQKETTQLLNKITFFKPSEKTVRQVTEDVADFVENHHSSLLSSVRKLEEIPPTADLLVASLDGVNLSLREPGKKLGKPFKNPKMQQDEGETKTSKKTAMVAALSLYEKPKEEEDGEEEKKRPKNLETKYLGRMPQEGFGEIKKEFEEELKAVESKLLGEVEKLVIMDGQIGLWNYIEGKEEFKEYHRVLDFYHASEHLSEVSKMLYGESTKGKEWYEKYEEVLKSEEKGVETVLSSIRGVQGCKKLKGKSLKELESEMGYFSRNKEKMRYKEYLEKGWPIGSGPVEAACKTIVKTRMCRSGMHWTREGGQEILHLRCLVKSGRWESFWSAYSELRTAA
jgi:hypothetical protein